MKIWGVSYAISRHSKVKAGNTQGWYSGVLWWRQKVGGKQNPICGCSDVDRPTGTQEASYKRKEFLYIA